MRGVCFPQQSNDGPFSEALSRPFSGPFSGTIRSHLVWTYGKPLSLISAAIKEIYIRPLQVHDSLLVGNVVVPEPQYHQDHRYSFGDLTHLADLGKAARTPGEDQKPRGVRQKSITQTLN